MASKNKRSGGLGTFLFFAVLAGLLGYGIWQESQRDPELPERKYMMCGTAMACASWILSQRQKELDDGTANFHAVSKDAATVIVEHRLDSVRIDFHGGRVEDGRTLEEWFEQDVAAPFRAQACDELDHRAFIRMGGAMIYDYRFSDGEPLAKIVVNECPL